MEEHDKSEAKAERKHSHSRKHSKHLKHKKSAEVKKEQLD